MLFTVFNVDTQSSVSKTWVEERLQNAREIDDVFRNEFLYGVLFVSELASDVEVAKATQIYLTDIGVSWIGTLTGKTRLRTGPYIEVNDTLRPALRVFDDTHETFLQALDTDDKGLGPIPDSPYHIPFQTRMTPIKHKYQV